jgi:hypothetical protein
VYGGIFCLETLSDLWYNRGMPITEYSGENLLQNEIIQKIQKEADLLLQNKDVAGAWQGSAHLKTELAKLSQESVSPVLVDYRKITTKLKTLSLPLLDLEEIISLLKNNLEFIDKSYLHYFVGGIKAWVALRPEQEQKTAIDQILSNIPKSSPYYKDIEVAVQGAKENTRPVLKEASSILPNNITDKDNLFSKEESDDLQTHVKKVAEVGVSGLKVENLDKISQEIFKISQSKEEQQAFLLRTQALLKSRLRDVRTRLDLQEYFARPFTVGGLGLSGEILDKSINISEDAYRLLHKENASEIVSDEPSTIEQKTEPKPKVVATVKIPETPVVKTQPKAIPSPVVREIKKQPIPKPVAKFVTPKPIPKPAKKIEQKTELDKLISQESSDSVDISSLISGKSNIAPKPIIPKQNTPEIKRSATRIIRTENNTNGKQRMDDITHTQSSPSRASIQTVDLTGELNLFTLNDFRKLGTPDQATQSLLQKLDVLEQDSIPKKIQGIKSLRGSELNKQYIAIGESSIGGGRKLADVLSDKSLNPDEMTEDEFFAITTLNSKLK